MKVKIFILAALLLLLFLGCILPGDMPTPDNLSVLDVHGAGAQRSDPKTGNPDDYPTGFGPQGDVIRIYNYVRLVRDDITPATTYPIVDTGQTLVFNNLLEISEPVSGEDFFGQDARNNGLSPSYTDIGNETIKDNSTGLMWQNSIDSNNDGNINADDKLTHTEALSYAANLSDGTHTDWRLPTIKELYSKILFNGEDISGYEGTDTSGFTPFVDRTYFDIEYGDLSSGDRLIDVQFATSTIYVSTSSDYGINSFSYNLDETIIDEDNGTNYPFFWTSTTHKSYRTGYEGANAVYIAFGEALGFME